MSYFITFENMNTAQAKAAIQSQIEKLDSDECALYGIVWISQTRSYIRDIFGDDSQEVKAFSNFIPLNDAEYHIMYGPFSKWEVENRMKEARNVLLSFIDTLDYKEPVKKIKPNFLQLISNSQLIAYGLTTLLVVFILGVLAGRTTNIHLYLKGILSIFGITK